LKTLSLDTSTIRGSVALFEDGALLCELRLASLETHAARLLRSIEFLLTGVGWRLEEIALVAAGLGPGSFTGIRIGLSTALGLAQTLKIPFAGISGLDALAHSHACLGGRMGILMDAQRGQVYYAEYAAVRGRIRKTMTAGLWFPRDLKPKLMRRHLRLIGDGAGRHLAELGLRLKPWEIIDPEPFLAGPIGKLAMERKRSWRRGEFLACEPLYIRPPDARKPPSRNT
jgi:tRNA threonylcarbamoyladenosine biosynthesis protein TsaB